jgi:hypothetical protein
MTDPADFHLVEQKRHEADAEAAHGRNEKMGMRNHAFLFLDLGDRKDVAGTIRLFCHFPAEQAIELLTAIDESDEEGPAFWIDDIRCDIERDNIKSIVYESNEPSMFYQLVHMFNESLGLGKDWITTTDVFFRYADESDE